MAVTRLSAPKPWHARHGIVHFAKASDVTITTNSILSAAFSTSTRVESHFKNLTVTPPEIAHDKQDLIGVDSSNFQNAVLDKKPAGMATFSGTAMLGNDESLESYLDESGVSITDVTYGNSTRYQIGNGDLPEIAVCIVMEDAANSKRVTFVLDNAYVTKWGDVRIGGPDSHWEQDVTVACLPKDFYWEYRD